MKMVETFSTEIEVRFSDLDAYGHVNNAVIFTYLETARTKLLLKSFLEYMDKGVLFLVARAECDYKKPIDLSDQVLISLELSRIGNSSFDIDYRVHNGDGTFFAEAKTVMVCYDQNIGKPVRVPEDFKSFNLSQSQ